MADWSAARRGFAGLGRMADEANEQFVALARSVSRLLSWTPSSLKRRARGSAAMPLSEAGPDAGKHHAEPAPEADWGELLEREAQQRLRQLFHGEGERRLQAARWLRENRALCALATLEGALRIEEDESARREMFRAVRELRSASSISTGL